MFGYEQEHVWLWNVGPLLHDASSATLELLVMKGRVTDDYLRHVIRQDPRLGDGVDLGVRVWEQGAQYVIDSFEADAWIVECRPLVLVNAVWAALRSLTLNAGEHTLDDAHLLASPLSTMRLGLPNHTLALRTLDALYYLALLAPAGTTVVEVGRDAESYMTSNCMSFGRARAYKAAGLSPQEAREAERNGPPTDQELALLTALRSGDTGTRPEVLA